MHLYFPHARKFLILKSRYCYVQYSELILVIYCKFKSELSYHQNFKYCKNSKNWDTRNNYNNCPTIGTVGFYNAVLCSKDADRITNREDPDQTAPCGAV